MHRITAKHVPRYIAVMVDYGLHYIMGDGVRLAGYSNFHWVGCASDQKSISGCCFELGLAVVSWFNRKQKSVALCSVEANYMDTSQANCDDISLCKLLVGLLGRELRSTIIYCDNQSCIKLYENPVFHDQSKHIEIKYHFIQDWVQRGVGQLEYTSTDD